MMSSLKRFDPEAGIWVPLVSGRPGDPNTLSIGEVVTLSPGTNATAEITGDSPQQVLNLGLPQGDAGPQGTQGAHKESHAMGGADALTPADIGAQPAGSYAPASHDHAGVYDPAGTAASAVAAVTPADIGAAPASHAHTLDQTTDTDTRVAMTPAERTKLASSGNSLPTIVRTTPNRWRFPVANASASTDAAVTAGACNYVPIATPAQSWNGAGLRVWTAEEGVTIELGLYSDNDGYPGAKLFSQVVDASTTGVKVVDVEPVAVPAGVVWGAVLIVGGANVLRIASTGHVGGSDELLRMNHGTPYGENITSYVGGMRGGFALTELPSNAPTGMSWGRWVAFLSIRGA